MAAKLFISGIDFSDVTEGLDTVQITYSQGESKLVAVSVSNELKLTGAGHKYLYSVFMANPCEGKFARVAATIVLDCCDNGDELSFLIDYKGITSSSNLDCETVINLIALNPLQKCYEYLRDIPYFYGGFSSNYDSPKIRYMIQRKNYFALIALLQFLYPALLILELIEQALRAVISVVSFIIRGIAWLIGSASLGNAVATFLESNFNLPSIDNYLAYITGAGNYHFAPYVKDIFEHSLDAAGNYGGCGLNLDMELLDLEPYSELALFQAFSKGYKIQNISRKFNFNAVYNRTFIQLLEEIELVFRLKSGITPSGQVVVASENRYHEKAPLIFNAEKAFIDGDAEEAPAYTFEDKILLNLSSLTYTEDSTDQESKYKLNPEYSDIVLHGNFTGGEKLEKTFPFGPARFMFDSETASKDNFLDIDEQRDELRAGINMQFIVPFYNSNWDDVAELPRDRDLILSDHTCDLPKLLVLEPGTDINDAKVLRRRMTGSTKYWKYNYPMHLEANESYQELYKRFHYVDSPSSLEDRIVILKDFTINLNSEMLTLIRDNGLFVGVQTIYGKATPTEIVINSNNCTATFKGCKYTCT